MERTNHSNMRPIKNAVIMEMAQMGIMKDS
jgi:hypothetical protein